MSVIHERKTHTLTLTTEKQCSKCKLIQPTSQFHKNARNRDGMQKECISCRRRQTRKEPIAAPTPATTPAIEPAPQPNTVYIGSSPTLPPKVYRTWRDALAYVRGTTWKVIRIFLPNRNAQTVETSDFFTSTQVIGAIAGRPPTEPGSSFIFENEEETRRIDYTTL